MPTSSSWHTPENTRLLRLIRASFKARHGNYGAPSCLPCNLPPTCATRLPGSHGSPVWTVPSAQWKLNCTARATERRDIHDLLLKLGMASFPPSPTPAQLFNDSYIACGIDPNAQGIEIIGVLALRVITYSEATQMAYISIRKMQREVS